MYIYLCIKPKTNQTISVGFGFTYSARFQSVISVLIEQNNPLDVNFLFPFDHSFFGVLFRLRW